MEDTKLESNSECQQEAGTRPVKQVTYLEPAIKVDDKIVSRSDVIAFLKTQGSGATMDIMQEAKPGTIGNFMFPTASPLLEKKLIQQVDNKLDKLTKAVQDNTKAKLQSGASDAQAAPQTDQEHVLDSERSL